MASAYRTEYPTESTVAAAPSRRPRRRDPLLDHPPSSELAFPGCKPVHLPREALETWDGRLEFWDGATETAWVCEPTSPYHEKPGGALPSLTERIAQVRGSPITCYGSMDLMVRGEHGEPWRILQADQSLYLHPGRARLPGAVAMELGKHDLPDVVLEVDHTTDVRRRKLGIYEAWGFPEVWVLVPPESRLRPPGLDIHLRRSGRYRPAPESGAFPGWRAEEIYLALIEGPVSSRARPALERVAREMGAREGTRPEDDPISRTIARHAEARGREAGRREGREEGWREATVASALAVLRARGIEATARLAGDRALFRGVSDDALMEAAVVCRDEADFRRRIRDAAR